MGKIVILTPTKGIKPLSRVERLSLAGWHLSHAVLWPEKSFTKIEKERAILLIKGYLVSNPSSSFIDFCERILLAHLQSVSTSFHSLPSVWLNEKYDGGYSSTKALHTKCKEMQKQIPGYLSEIHVLARYYYKYQFNASKICVSACRRTVLQLNAYQLLPLFYRIISYHRYL
jgi:hypothetical protein